MNKLEETIGFLEMLKRLNKTKVEIDLIMPMLAEMQEEAINYNVVVNNCRKEVENVLVVE